MKKATALFLLLVLLAFVTVSCQSAASDLTATAPSATPASATGNSYQNPAAADGQVQTVTTKFSSRRYAPLTVQVGIPVEWTIQVDAKDLNGCNYAISIPKLGITQQLATGETTITFTPLETGTIPYSCWMGMIRSSIIVVDDLISPEALASAEPNDAEEAIQPIYDDVEALSIPYTDAFFEAGGCCGF